MKAKTCIHCHTQKDMDQFPKAVTNADGHDNRCKACMKKLNKHHKLLRKQGLNKPTRKIKRPEDVHIEPFNPELETQRHLQNLINQFGIEGAKAKLKLQAFAT